MGWAIFRVIFSETRLVTLLQLNSRCETAATKVTCMPMYGCG
jgi:hypothetical protein